MIRLAFGALFIPAALLITPDSAFAQAATSMKCGDGSVVHVTTGTSGGHCNTTNQLNCSDGGNTNIDCEAV